VKTKNRKQLEKELWDVCRHLTRTKYEDVCYTCGRDNLIGSNWHTGHMIPKHVLPIHLKYDLRVLRPQCYKCNIHLGGNGALYLWKWLDECGMAAAVALFEEMMRPEPADVEFWLQCKIDEYKLK
jgi:hypothetical protein